MKISFWTGSNAMNPHNSYGKLQLGLWRAMDAMGTKCNALGEVLRGGQRWLGDLYQNGTAANVILNVYKPQTIISGRGQVPDARLWLLTMSESTSVGRQWVSVINEFYERVFVPSEPLVQVYQDSGVTVPVHYVPCGVDFYLPGVADKKLAADPFIWLTHSNGDMRKGVDRAIMAFKRLFDGDMRHRLWIKCQWSKGGYLEGLRDDQIALVPGTLSEQAWFELLKNVQVFLWPSRGEGFGLMAREATLAGVPSIATQWLGMHDVDQWGYPVRVKELRPSQFWHEEANKPGGMWSEPDLEHLCEQMAWVHGHYVAACEKAAKGREFLLKGFTYQKMAKGMVEWL